MDPLNLQNFDGYKASAAEIKAPTFTQSSKPSVGRAKIDFSDVMFEAIDNVRHGFSEAEKASTNAMLGQGSPHSAMIALTKANLSFRFLAQTRNKAIEAYREIMNMQM